MIKLPTIRQLQYFLALVEHEHFGNAAEASFVSQSAFSTAIQDLEELLGANLADRTNRQVTITATGQDIATQARLVIRDAETLREIAGERHEPLSANLRLGVIPTIAPFLLPRIVP
jgi:LysR family hydrogen peroxide-inducible transcriptional activator